MVRNILLLLVLLPGVSLSADMTGGEAVDLPGNSNKKENQVTEPSITRSYEGGMRGLKALMRDLKQEDRDVYNHLYSDYRSLRTRHRTANGVGWASTLGGIATFLDWMKANREDDDSFDDFDDHVDTMLVGFGIYYLGHYVSSLIAPKNQDYKDFTNRHNELNPQHQIRWDSASLKFVGEDKTMMLALKFKF